MFESILVPVDFTEKNQAAIKIALDLAKISRGKITLLHVIEQVDLVPQKELTEFYKKLNKDAEDNMSALLSSIGAAYAIETVVLLGKRAKEIVTWAADSQIDLIIMNSHKVDTSRLEDWGSISYKVAILSACPVLLVK